MGVHPVTSTGATSAVALTSIRFTCAAIAATHELILKIHKLGGKWSAIAWISIELNCAYQSFMTLETVVHLRFLFPG